MELGYSSAVSPQPRLEEGEGGGLALSLTHCASLPSLPPSLSRTRTKTLKSVLSMNVGRIDHNFRGRESIRGSADSAAEQAEKGRQRRRGPEN